MVPSNEKVASSEVGVWIDLYTGKLYGSEQEVIQAKQQEEEIQEEYALVAKRIQNLFLKLGYRDSYTRMKNKYDDI